MSYDMTMTSVCYGCAHEQACGHAGMRSCSYRKPARWCSCDMLRRAQAERDALLRLKREREAEIVRLEEELARMHDIENVAIELYDCARHSIETGSHLMLSGELRLLADRLHVLGVEL